MSFIADERIVPEDDENWSNGEFSDSKSENGLLADEDEATDVEDEQENSAVSNCIVNLSQTKIRGKNGHILATSKRQTSYRTSVINIVRMAIGPARSMRNKKNPVDIFESFITKEILKWTNVEISIKKQNYDKKTPLPLKIYV